MAYAAVAKLSLAALKKLAKDNLGIYYGPVNQQLISESGHPSLSGMPMDDRYVYLAGVYLKRGNKESAAIAAASLYLAQKAGLSPRSKSYGEAQDIWRICKKALPSRR